jgi:hypothetical protein
MRIPPAQHLYRADDSDMRSAVCTLTQLRSVLRLWRSRRGLPPLCVLLLALYCVIGEPLACMLHCQFVFPWLPHHQHVDHSHMHTAPLVAPPSSATAAMAFAALAATTPDDAPCVYTGGQHDAPSEPVPPAPIHDAIYHTSAKLGEIALIQRLISHEPPQHVQCSDPPPTPPPLPV